MKTTANEVLMVAQKLAAQMASMTGERRRFYGSLPVAGAPAKVFVAQIHAAGFGHIDLDAFKVEIAAMSARGELTLARCDLVQAFERVAVAASETPRMNARFHFVEVG
jgi:hypothetical protein